MAWTVVRGNVGQEPELRDANGTAVCDLSVAATGASRDEATWVRCTVWRDTAEWVAAFIQKGQFVQCEGPITVRTYEKNDGSTGTSLEMNAQNVWVAAPRAPRRAQGNDEELPF